MVEFEKGENTVKLNDNYSRANLNVSLKVQDKASAYLVDIPAFNIHFYVKHKQDIEKSTHESLVSFFNFWIHQQSLDHFIQHMSALGFTVLNKNVHHVAEPDSKYGNTTTVSIDRLILS